MGNYPNFNFKAVTRKNLTFVSLRHNKLNHLNLQYIYLISYKIANPLERICPYQICKSIPFGLLCIFL